ncbi:hypothetical protein FKM82_004031 [Ascaphus truei]
MPLGISVSLQTDASWLREHFHQQYAAQTPESLTPPAQDLYQSTSDHKEDLFSSLSDDLSELSILCDMEFSSDYTMFFEKPLQTLPSVGPPTILAYKRESLEHDRFLAMKRIVRRHHENETCEFCAGQLRPFPCDDSLEPEEHFCCDQYKEVFEFLYGERKRLFGTDKIETISIAPHAPYGNEVERRKAKEKSAQRRRERQMAKFFAAMVTEPTASFPDYGRQLKTISYQLSTAPPLGDNWTVVPESPESALDAEKLEREFSCCDFTMTRDQMMSQFLEKYYRNGRKFLTMFPDGTAQIFYPSGNLAIIVVANKVNESFCIVQEDKTNAKIQAVFGSYGKATCYHPNGVVWININLSGGHYSDNTGRRVKRWKWKSNFSSEPCAQFKPIFLSLNHHVGVRIFAQDQMFISFLAMGKQAKFNVGVKRKVKQIETKLALKKEVPEVELLLFAMKIKILSLFDTMHSCLNFPSNEQWYRLNPPSFLLSETHKLINLCRVCTIGKDIDSSIREILGNHMEL